MKWTAWIFGSVAAAALMAGCGGERRGDAGTAGEGAETGTMPGDAGVTSDTAMPETGATGAARADTSQAGARLQPDTNNPAPGPDTASWNPSDTIRPPGDTAANPSR